MPPQGSLPTPCATHSPPTCLRAGRIFVRSRNYWGTPLSPPLRCTPMCPRPTCGPSTGGPTREPEMSVGQKLNGHDVQELWRRFKESGDGKARDELILAYSPLVKYVAGRMGTGLPAHVEESDLISYGLLGLIGALERFDPSRNIRFETYAISRIKGSMIDELRALDWVPRSVRSWARQVERAVTKLENQLRHAPA